MTVVTFLFLEGIHLVLQAMAEMPKSLAAFLLMVLVAQSLSLEALELEQIVPVVTSRLMLATVQVQPPGEQSTEQPALAATPALAAQSLSLPALEAPRVAREASSLFVVVLRLTAMEGLLLSKGEMGLGLTAPAALLT